MVPSKVGTTFTSDFVSHSLLCADCLLRLVRERTYQYQNSPIKFDVQITRAAQFSFIQVQPSQFRRAVSNLVVNAVDALSHCDGPRVTMNLDADERHVFLSITDNGKGMPGELLQNIRQRRSFTAGKPDGHGIGLTQVWDMVEFNHVQLDVDSEPGHGTRFALTIPRANRPDWMCDEITVRYDDIVLFFGSDASACEAWRNRLAPFSAVSHELTIQHVNEGQLLLDFIKALREDDRHRVFLLCHHESTNPDQNELNIIAACNVERAVLITADYDDVGLQQAAMRQGLKLLPKQMALVTPLFCQQRYGILRIDVEHITYDKKFYDIEQMRAQYFDNGTRQVSLKKAESTPRPGFG